MSETQADVIQRVQRRGGGGLLGELLGAAISDVLHVHDTHAVHELLGVGRASLLHQAVDAPAVVRVEDHARVAGLPHRSHLDLLPWFFVHVCVYKRKKVVVTKGLNKSDSGSDLTRCVRNFFTVSASVELAREACQSAER